MELMERIDLMDQLGNYLSGDDEEMKIIRTKAFDNNRWFAEEFIDLSLKIFLHGSWTVKCWRSG